MDTVVQRISRQTRARLRLSTSTSCRTPHPPRSRMPIKTLRLVKKTTTWTESRKVDKAKVLLISRSKSKTDGSPLPMVGAVSYPVALSPLFYRTRNETVPSLALPIAYGCAAPLEMVQKTRWSYHVRTAAVGLRVPYHLSSAPSKFAMNCTKAHLPQVSGTWTTQRTAPCLLTVLLPMNPTAMEQGRIPTSLLHLMLTSATLLQWLES